MEKVRENNRISQKEHSFLSSYLLSCGIKNPEDVSCELLLRYLGLNGLYEASYGDIAEEYGEGAACAVRLMVALNKRRITDSFKMNKLYSKEQLETYLKSLLFGAVSEVVYMLTFDKSDRLTSSVLVGEGTVNMSVVSVGQLMEIAARRSAKSIILVHNHPGGDNNPSEADLFMTARIKNSFSSLGITLKAHYIVSSSGIIDIMGLISDRSAEYTDELLEVAKRIKSRF